MEVLQPKTLTDSGITRIAIEKQHEETGRQGDRKTGRQGDREKVDRRRETRRHGEERRNMRDGKQHSWAQQKLSPLSPLSPLNIWLSINGPLISF